MTADLNRREFVAGVSAVCAGLCLTCGMAEAQTTTSAPAGPVEVGNVKDYPKDSVSDKFAKSNNLLIAHQEDQIFAMSNKCTHKNVALKIADDQTLKCPAHGSIFTDQGTVTKGPAKVSLTRYAISQDADGNLVVDKSKSFGEKEWEKPAAFVKVG